MNRNLGSDKRPDVYKYFKTNDEGDYICQCEGKQTGALCLKKISASKPTRSGKQLPSRSYNLKRHLRNAHEDVYNDVIECDRAVSESHSSRSKPTEQPLITSYCTENRVQVSMSRETFIKHLVDLVVKNGVSLSVFESTAFRGLAGQMANKFGVPLSRNNVRELVTTAATNAKQRLKETLKGRTIFLKMDGATRQRVHYFAINVQFMNDDMEITTKTLAVRDTRDQQSAEILKNLVLEVMQEFGVTKQQILAIVTDNARNMISTLKKLNEESEPDGEECDVDSIALSNNIEHMRCAVHTLQLAIRDGLKDTDTANLLQKVRSLATEARTPSVRNILKRRVGRLAVLDQATRWGSTYLMLERILDLKDTLSDMALEKFAGISDNEWETLDKIKKTLYPAFVTTKNLQEASILPGSFLMEWGSLKQQLSRVGTELAQKIIDAMKSREEVLLNNDVLLAAVYVDPKYRIMLNDAQFARAKHALCSLAMRINGVEEDANTEESARSSSSSSGDEFPSFEKYLDEKESSKRRRLETHSTTPIDRFKVKFQHVLPDVERIHRASRISVLEAIPIYPKIVQQAAMAATALPCSQVSVERLFSALRFIVSDLRSTMKEDLVEAILFLRTNDENG